MTMRIPQWWQNTERRNELVKQVLRFGISGGTAALFGIVSLYVLTDVLHVWYVVSSVISFLVAFLTTFTLQKFWTFREKTISRIPVQSALNLVLAGLNLILNAVLIYALVDFLHVAYLIAQLIIYALFGVVDFFIYKLIIFKPWKV